MMVKEYLTSELSSEKCLLHENDMKIALVTIEKKNLSYSTK